MVLPLPAAPSSPSQPGASQRSPRPAAGRRTLPCYVHPSAPMSALRSVVGGGSRHQLNCLPHSAGTAVGGLLGWAPCGGGPVCLVLGGTHPGLQPVTAEPQLVPLLLHLLKLAPQLLDLFLGCSKAGKVSQRHWERLGPRSCTLGVHEAGEAQAGTQGHWKPLPPWGSIPRPFPIC